MVAAEGLCCSSGSQLGCTAVTAADGAALQVRQAAVERSDGAQQAVRELRQARGLRARCGSRWCMRGRTEDVAADAAALW